MTEQSKFVQDQNAQDSGTAGNFQPNDQTGGDQAAPDTHSPEHQLSVLQKRLNDSQDYIKNLESENQQTREMYASAEERLKNMGKIEEVLNQRNAQDVGNQENTGLDEDALVGKVIENLNKKQTEEAQQKNYNNVLNKLSAEFGEQYVEDKVSEAARSNGLTVDDMVSTARKSPDAFYTLMGMKRNTQQGVQTPTPTRGTQQPPQDSNTKDFAYYSNLMRTNPREYWKAETQREFRKLFQHK